MAFLLLAVVVGAILGVVTAFFPTQKGRGGTWIPVLLGVGGSLAGAFVGGALGLYDYKFGVAILASVGAVLVGALIVLGPYVLLKRSAVRGSAAGNMGGKTLSPTTSTSTPQPTDVQSDETAQAHIDHQDSNSIGPIFLSYASSDRPTAQALAKALQNEGWSVWWDRTIPPGKNFDEVIEAALDAAKCVIVLWSRTSVTSEWVKVEAAEAARRRILIPALIAQVTIPLEFRRLQAADLVDWSGSGSHPGFQSLVGSIADVLGNPKASGARPPAR